jgi:hypothetical protein
MRKLIPKSDEDEHGVMQKLIPKKRLEEFVNIDRLTLKKCGRVIELIIKLIARKNWKITDVTEIVIPKNYIYEITVAVP